MDPVAAKKQVRSEMRARRREVSAVARELVARTLCKRLFCVDPKLGKVLDRKGTVAVYLASSDEIDLSRFIVLAMKEGCTVVAPRWNGAEYEMVPLACPAKEDWTFEDLDLVKGPHGILEPPPGTIVPPRDVDAWLIPGLAFTRDGRRLGYGGGWYDRLLVRAKPRALKIGIAYSFQIVADLPHEPHDILLTDVADAVPCESVEPLRTGKAELVARQLRMRPFVWGLSLWPDHETEAVAKRCAQILTEAFGCEYADLIPADTLGAIHALDHYGDLDDVEAILAIEAEFACEIPSDLLKPELTFGDFVGHVVANRGKSKSKAARKGCRPYGCGVIYALVLLCAFALLLADMVERVQSLWNGTTTSTVFLGLCLELLFAAFPIGFVSLLLCSKFFTRTTRLSRCARLYASRLFHGA